MGTSLSSIYGGLKAELFMRFRGSGIDPFVDELREENGIIIKDQRNWGSHGPGEVDRFRKKISGVKFPESTPLIIRKGPGATLDEVAKAVEVARELKDRRPCMFPLSMDISTDIAVDRIVTGKGRMTVSRDLLQHRLLLPQRISLREFIRPAKNRRLISHPFRTGLLPEDIIDKDGFSDQVNERLKSVTFGSIASGRHSQPFIDIKSWMMHLPGLRALSFPKKQFDQRFLDHTLKVVATYNQISELFIDPWFFQMRDQKGLQRLFNPAIPEKRIQSNLAFIRELYLLVPMEIMYPTLLLHDIGKLRDEPFHHEESFKMIDEHRLLDYCTLPDEDKLAIKCAIKYHVIPGGLSLGEYSLMIFDPILRDHDMLRIMRAGRFPLFMDTLTLLTICDIAGYDSPIPLNRRIENYRHLNSALKSLAASLEINRVRSRLSINALAMHNTLFTEATRAVDERIVGFLSVDDANKDINTRFTGNYFYIEKVEKALKKLKVSARQWERVRIMLALMRSFTYSGRFLSYIFWKNPEEMKKVTASSEINDKALSFLVYLSNKLDLQSEVPIDAVLIKRDGKPLGRDDYDRCVLEFARQLAAGRFPDVEVAYGPDSIDLRIIMPDPEEDKRAGQPAK